jgi:hypothetical protein
MLRVLRGDNIFTVTGKNQKWKWEIEIADRDYEGRRAVSISNL